MSDLTTTPRKPRSARLTALVGVAAGAALGLTVGLGLPGSGTPAAAAAPLRAFSGCEQLRQWYVDRALPLVGPYGLGGGAIAYGAMEDSVGSGRALSSSGSSSGSMPGSAPAPQAPAADSQTSSGTGTNVQETGVDEPDLAKTDGDLVVRVRGDRLVVARVGDGQVGAVQDVGSLGLPAGLAASELLLSGTRVLVVGSPSSYAAAVPGPAVDLLPEMPASSSPAGPVDPIEPLPFAPYSLETSRVVEVDLTDPASPRVLTDRTYGGRLLSARQYDAAGAPVVRLVLQTESPTLDFVAPNRGRTAGQALAENRRIVRESQVWDWLPQVRDSGSGTAQDLLDCRDVRHPGTGDGTDLGTLSVVTLPFSDPTATTATAVTTAASTVYSSTDRLYLALSAGEATTDVHAFALDGASTRYTASGTVQGTVRDRWSMDEHDGVLRLAVAYGGWGTGAAADNGVVTLREDGERLDVLGSVRGLGPDEEVKSVRWFDDLAVVVTFRQTDPLYTVDLRVPSRPRTLGALKIPGFSTYLHPLGDGRLLGLGQDASLDGQVRGSQASVLDVSDLADPRRLSRLPVDDATLIAEWDPRALTWLPAGDGAGVALVGASSQLDGRTSVLELVVGSDGTLTRGRSWPLGSASSPTGPATPRALPLGDGRVALVGDTVTVVRAR